MMDEFSFRMTQMGIQIGELLQFLREMQTVQVLVDELHHMYTHALRNNEMKSAITIGGQIDHSLDYLIEGMKNIEERVKFLPEEYHTQPNPIQIILLQNSNFEQEVAEFATSLSEFCKRWNQERHLAG